MIILNQLEKKMGKNRQQLGKDAKSKVESELKKRGYTVLEARTELSVKSPSGVVFRIKVTSLSYPNAWIVKVKDSSKDKNRYFILVFQPENKKPDLFVFTPDEMWKEKQIHLSSMRKPLGEYSNPDLEKAGLAFDQALRYKDKWSSLPK
jgi:hypothetical protein